MKREELKKIIKLTSFWKIDKRKGDYKLPSGCRLSDYLEGVVWKFVDAFNLAILGNGEIADKIGDYIEKPFSAAEPFDRGEQYKRRAELVAEIIEGR